MATRVRQLIPIGTHINEGGDYIANQVGDEYEIDDRYLNPEYAVMGGPATVEELVESYVEAGYVEVAE